MNNQQILDKAEELIEHLDPDEKNKKLMTLYRFIHSHNKNHSCFRMHEKWREESGVVTKCNQLKNK